MILDRLPSKLRGRYINQEISALVWTPQSVMDYGAVLAWQLICEKYRLKDSYITYSIECDIFSANKPGRTAVVNAWNICLLDVGFYEKCMNKQNSKTVRAEISFPPNGCKLHNLKYPCTTNNVVRPLGWRVPFFRITTKYANAIAVIPSMQTGTPEDMPVRGFKWVVHVRRCMRRRSVWWL